ncbi:MAG: hypothetical protein JST70_18935 [Bacteroidetes bacterium]|nr:hypothetical protein [Bacteroidota bacterium]
MNPRKDPLFVSLIIVLFCVIVVGGYYYGRHKLSLWINGEPINQHITGNAKKDISENSTVSMSGVPVDSGQFLQPSENTSEVAGKPANGDDAATKGNKSAANPPANNIINIIPRTDTPDFGKSIKAMTSPSTNDNEEETADNTPLISVSDNNDVVCQLKNGKTHKLLVYPAHSGWRSIYVIAPVADRKNLPKKSIIQPEFEGVSYPTFKGLHLFFKGKKYDVVQISFQSTSVDLKHQYSILLQSNPSFLIFGEQKNSDMYVFENGRVTKFTPTADNFNLTDN